MNTMRVLSATILLAAACAVAQPSNSVPPSTTRHLKPATHSMTNKLTKTDAEWQKELTPEQYRVLREKDTERAFTGKFWNTHEDGTYKCAGCGLELFKSEAKFDSGCGWPSFSAPATTNAVATHDDTSFGMHRIEVLCPRCGGHLGHVFDDGPAPTGQRYCINSASLKFEKADEPAVNQDEKK